MINVLKTPDFSNHDFFLGIDVHKKSWKVTIRNRPHQMKCFSADPSPEGLARHMLIEASWMAVRKDPALTEAFLEHTRRMPKNQAIIRIARKLLNRIRHVWKSECLYQIGVVGR